MSEISELHPRSLRYAGRALAHAVFEKILVVMDSTMTAHPGVEKAARLAGSFGSTLELFTCDVDRDVPPSWAGGTTLAQYRGLVRERRLAMLEALAAPLRTRGIHVTTECAWSASLADSVVAHAIRTQADLVVKDTHGHAPTSQLPAVQTDRMLIQSLPMPLLLVRPTEWGAHPAVAVSVDPCHVAERPVELDDSLVATGSSIGRGLSGRVCILHALQSPPHLPGERPTPEATRLAHEQQRNAVARVAERGLIEASAVRFAERNIPEGIVELVREARAAVLVMGVAAGQRARGPAASTAAQVLEQITCDLLVVKPAGFVSPALVTNA